MKDSDKGSEEAMETVPNVVEILDDSPYDDLKTNAVNSHFNC